MKQKTDRSRSKYKYLLLHPHSTSLMVQQCVAVVPGSGPGPILGSDLSRQPGSLLAQPLLQRGSEAVVGMRSSSRPAPQPQSASTSPPVVWWLWLLLLWLGSGPAPQPPLSLPQLVNVGTSQCSHETESKYCTGGLHINCFT